MIKNECFKFGGYCFKHQESLESFNLNTFDERIHLIDWIKLTSKRVPTLVLYSLQRIILHNFDEGIEIEYCVMAFLVDNVVYFPQSDHELKINEDFEEIPGILRSKNFLQEHEIKTFVDSLRHHVFIYREFNVNQMILLNIDSPVEKKRYLDLIAKCTKDSLSSENFLSAIRNLTITHLNFIRNAILSTDINSETSPNIFNLSSTKTTQQNALNIKKIIHRSNCSDESDFNFFFTRIDNLILNKLYIIPISCKELNYYKIKISRPRLKLLLEQNIIYALKVRNISISTVVADISIEKLLVDKFTQKVKLTKEILIIKQLNRRSKHYRIMSNSSYLEDTNINKWIIAEPYYLKLLNRSNVTLKDNSSMTEFYGIFCKNSVEEIIARFRPKFIVKYMVNYSEFRFYYVLFLIRNCKRCSFFSYLIEKIDQKCWNNCFALSSANYTSLLEDHWASRNCCTFVYSNYFNFFISNYLAYVKNLTFYLYLQDSNHVLPIPKTNIDATNFCCIFMKAAKNFKRDYEKKAIKMSNFETYNDGPLINAVSIRACESLTNPLHMNKRYQIRTTNETALLNIPMYCETQDPRNLIKF